ncbi:MAG: general secretion pathway protein H [Hyphomicrobiaceae bacterium]|jgi:general secretion pathway protein H
MRAVRDQRGFTLLELVVVVVIMGVAVGIAAPSVRSGWQQSAVRRSVRQFIASVRGTSSRAIRTRKPATLAVWPEQGMFGAIGGKKNFSLPAFGEFGDIEGGRVEEDDNGDERILFDFGPSGSADGGRIELAFRTSSGAQSYTLKINGLLGTVSIEENDR